jgi:methyl-accepting chemotaxis protein
MVQTEEGNNRALVVYKTPSSSLSKRPASPSQHPEMPDNDSTITPFTPSKRQYCEIDESISLREKNRTLTAINETLIEQQAILTQRADEASQMAREAEESAQAARDAMQLAQAKFEENMTEKCQSYFTRLMVSCIRQ